MGKVIFQLIIAVAIFFLTWFGLSKADWINTLNVKQTTKTTEEKLGDLFWEIYNKAEREIHRKKIINPVDSLLSKICSENKIDRSTIKLHIVMNSEVNAYTLPNRHLVIFSGLILSCKNEEELCGVLGHEIGHMENDHVMKKLIKEVGLTVLISATAGSSGGGQAIKELAKTVTSTAYDREMEHEADLSSVSYLINAGINPKPFADFLLRLSQETKHLPKQFFWVTTHPDSEERAEGIYEFIKDKKIDSTKVISDNTWESLLNYLEDEE